jgi:hypothetical protein
LPHAKCSRSSSAAAFVASASSAGWCCQAKKQPPDPSLTKVLKQSYPDRALSGILGIVTPFAAQVERIRSALNALGIDTEQGAGTGMNRRQITGYGPRYGVPRTRHFAGLTMP